MSHRAWHASSPFRKCYVFNYIFIPVLFPFCADFFRDIPNVPSSNIRSSRPKIFTLICSAWTWMQNIFRCPWNMLNYIFSRLSCLVLHFLASFLILESFIIDSNVPASWIKSTSYIRCSHKQLPTTCTASLWSVFRSCRLKFIRQQNWQRQKSYEVQAIGFTSKNIIGIYLFWMRLAYFQ